jgi:hypothetical protein
MEFRNFPKFLTLKRFGVFYLQKGAGPIGPVPPGRGLISAINRKSRSSPSDVQIT